MVGLVTRTGWLVMSGLLALSMVACQSASVTQAPTSPAPTSTPLKVVTSPRPSAVSARPTPAKPVNPTTTSQAAKPTAPTVQLISSPVYQQALNKAESATSISASAQSPEDWSLVASQWKEAIALMKQVPSNDPNRKNALQQLDRMEAGLSRSQQKMDALTRPSSTTVATGGIGGSGSEARKGIYRAPIKRYAGGIPVVDVMFNGQASFEMMVDTGASGTMITENMAQSLQVKPVGSVEAMTPSGRTRFNVGYLDSMSVGGGTLNSFPVAIGPVALLGHDFFGDCNISIKRDQNVVEFSQCNS